MQPFDLTKLSPQAFEHLVNQLAIRILGRGHTSFGPGADGGRDGLFEGEAPYPSDAEHWSGVWYIQSKFHTPNLSADAQKWLLTQIKSEIDLFTDTTTKRKWPDVWIVATNIEPSGAAETGSFDKARALLKKARPKLANKFHIWGGRKILDLLGTCPEVAAQFRHFLTPGHILTEILDQLADNRASGERVIRHLVVSQFEENQYTRLEQAGSSADSRPGIHKLFIDVPYQTNGKFRATGKALQSLTKSSSQPHRPETDPPPATDEWRKWQLHPDRARIWFLRGGPGRGKSTVGQYFSQIQRTALILQNLSTLRLKSNLRPSLDELALVAKKSGFYPEHPRIPIQIDLKDYAAWLGRRTSDERSGVLTYLSERLGREIEQDVSPGFLIRLFSARAWFIAFDGLDEVPQDVKDPIAAQIRYFVDDIAVENRFDLLSLCTSRPQGYSGQFENLFCATVDLVNLDREQALECAKPVLELDRSPREAREALARLTEAAESESVQQLMTTPLQSHIMAIVVRDGGKPPERKWRLFTRFYEVIKRRESNKNFPDPKLAKLLREDDRLLKTIHNRLGFALQARAEESSGAESSLSRGEFEKLVRQAAGMLLEADVEATVQLLMTATTDRLVLVSTPEAGNNLRFDVRPLQEFFAAEFLYESVMADTFRARLSAIAGDSHWREVTQFCISALIEDERPTETCIASEVLTALNSAPDGTPLAIYTKLARGAVLAARLLSEGVLEQDKRTRQQFAKCLDPLLSSSFIVDSTQLAQTSQPNSRSWLVDHLMSALRERNHTDSFGAALALALLTFDDSAHAGSFIEFLVGSPHDYSAAVLYYVIAQRHFRSSPQSPEMLNRRWVLVTAIRILKGSDWPAILRHPYLWAMGYHFDTRRVLTPIFQEEGIGTAEQWLFHRIFFTRHRETGMPPSARKEMESWDEVINPAKGQDHGLIGEITLEVGIFKAFSPLIEYVKRPSSESLRSLARQLITNRIDLETLAGIRLLLPLNPEYPIEPQLQRLAVIDDDEWDKLYASRSIGGIPLPAQSKQGTANFKTISSEQWGSLIRLYPRSSVIERADFLVNTKESMEKSGTESTKAWRDILSVWCDRPDIAAQQFYLFGCALGNFSSSQVVQFNAMLNAVSVIGPSWESDFFIRSQHGREFRVWPFKLDLPSQAGLLSFVVEIIYGRFAFGDTVFSRRGLARDKSNSLLVGCVNEYCPEPHKLWDLAADASRGPSERIAAAMLTVLHPYKSDSAAGRFECLLETIRSVDLHTTDRDLLGSLILIVATVGDVNDKSAVELLSRISDILHGSFSIRNAFTPLVMQWRERSFAPVTKANLQEKWLAETK